MHTATRKIEFDAGHRVWQHESKCNNIHGHRYCIELECVAIDNHCQLDKLGRVIDFGVMKSICGQWVDENLDHGMILYKNDPLLEIWECGFPINELGKTEKQKYYVMDKNPTAENLAEHLYQVFNRLLFDRRIRVVSIVVHETPNCKARYLE